MREDHNFIAAEYSKDLVMRGPSTSCIPCCAIAPLRVMQVIGSQRVSDCRNVAGDKPEALHASDDLFAHTRMYSAAHLIALAGLVASSEV